ncbi:MAG: hypothetical protein M1438_03995 [Deltaproteobacteria bacterium]|nr:hypothetical protein [Deltaproteobacteria bacterium]
MRFVKKVNTQDLLIKHLDMYMDIYKHHFNLFLKGVTIYLVSIGVIAGYIFKGDINIHTQAILSSLFIIESIGAFLCCVFSFRWINTVDKIVRRIILQLNVSVSSFPFGGVKGVILTTAMVAIVSSVAGVIIAIPIFSKIFANIEKGITLQC